MKFNVSFQTKIVNISSLSSVMFILKVIWFLFFFSLVRHAISSQHLFYRFCFLFSKSVDRIPIREKKSVVNVELSRSYWFNSHNSLHRSKCFSLDELFLRLVNTHDIYIYMMTIYRPFYVYTRVYQCHLSICFSTTLF